MRVCTKCAQERPDEHFVKRQGSCRGCRNEYKRHRRNDPLTRDIVLASQRRTDRKYYHANLDRSREVQREKNARWVDNNRAKRNAQLTLWHAVRMGRLNRPTACTDCGATCTPQGHHDDYTQPLVVRWLCTVCHGRTHWKVA